MPPRILRIHARLAFCFVLASASLLVPALTRAQDNASAPYGERQSPVNILSRDVLPDKNPLAFSGLDALKDPLILTVKNTAWGAWCPTCGGSVDQRWGSLKAYPEKGTAPRIRYGSDTYTLQEFHFHAPAEHLIDGQLAEMEVHFVFKKDGSVGCSPNTILVIGSRIVKGGWNRELARIFNGPKLPTNASAPYATVSDFVIANVIGSLDNTYRYSGSLTAPSDFSACGNPPGNPNDQLASGYLPEIVSWVLLRDPIEMSAEQIAVFEKLFPDGDARGPQAIKQRHVTSVFKTN